MYGYFVIVRGSCVKKLRSIGLVQDSVARFIEIW